ncbi:MAG: nitrile hydratase subunit alpha [Acidimicrobiia bacterium]|nr:nitrile hydratase subunit alpha [bacterium]MXX00761.1 nitrile hydratase subunit alpha [Acidimicrobiia bacterium]MDE0675018.1 nitrile hydratase subunit alpha [bacterium]MXX45266.1 nitrile hydratase subunit alpha [Acidimicrobiia bacterium]MXY75181.1 nitrile hydratase subunit alpha [Acidimicrobiia bacterium]
MSADHGHGGGRRHPGLAEGLSLSEPALRLLAMEELLVEKGVIGGDDVRRVMDVIAARSPADGARVVARAWTDPAFKLRLLEDPRAALAEVGYPVASGAVLSVVENTEAVHHLVVCTLCSCYPTSLLGPPPDWYKSFAYRSRAVADPRGVMREFGLEVDEAVEVRVVDSAADLRYMVLPRRPEGTEGMAEEDLVALVTRDSLVGVGAPNPPAAES